MVAPIYGPFTVVEDFSNFYRRKVRYKQKRPFTEPSPYSLYLGAVTKRTGNYATNVSYNPASMASQTQQIVLGSSALNQARILAYEKFKAKISDRASMGENLLEIETSLKTIEKRALQLVRFTNAIRKGHFGEAASILRTPEPRKRHPVKEQAGNWLEYHLGIEPVIGDIYSAIDVLQQPVKAVKVRARASGGPATIQRYRNTAPFSVGTKDWGIDQIEAQYQAEVAVSNPNLWLANTLGVLNPVQVAWQLTTLSFVLDWFVNVEQFLGTATDFFGLTVQKASTTSLWWASYSESYNTYGWQYGASYFGMERGLGIISPNLGLRPWKAPSWQRGLTAISLLVGGLKSLNGTTTKRLVPSIPMRDIGGKSAWSNAIETRHGIL